MNEILHGIIPPLVTPLKDRNTLDEVGLERVIERVLGGGVQGVFVLGSTGEASSLSYELRRQVINLSCEIVQDRVPVLVGIADTSLEETLALARYASKCGAYAGVLTTPYYVHAAQDELIAYIEELLSELPLPILLYNMPKLTKLSWEIETVERLMQHQQIIGFKDSSGDMSYTHRLLYAARARPDWSIFVGPESLMAEAVLMGAHGGVNGGAHIAPELLVSLYNAATQHDVKRIHVLQGQLLQLGEVLYGNAGYSGAIFRNLKCALAVLGVCSDFMAPPLRSPTEHERNQMRVALEKLEFVKV
ncbi:MAG TPA: dihydrodipicolinate synthase family protein [Abditibacteriaceae bacterium]|jgi:4-hydroxy-tetrahydrodipicolinate synthase